MTDITFVVALPGWDVLYYRNGRYDTAPVVAWGVSVDDNGFVRAVPVTSDVSWAVEDSRPIWTPDGEVTCGDLEQWPTIEAWLADMQKREIRRPLAPVLALDDFKHKLLPPDDVA